MNHTEQDYDDVLDEIYGTVEIAGHLYTTSEALKAVDPIAYDNGFNDWLTSEEDEIHLEPDEN